MQNAASMSLLYVGIILAGVGLLLAVIGIAFRAKASSIASAPLVKTGEAGRHTGAVGVEGTARAVQQALTAPCSGAPALFYRLLVQKKVKVKQGNQTSTSWKKVFDHCHDSFFALDDGSGPVQVHAEGELDGQLEQTFQGAPPGGPGLGSLTAFAPPGLTNDPREEILEYKATESVIRPDSRLFLLGEVRGGTLGKGAKQLMVSTRGRDALVGATAKKAMAFIVAGLAILAGGATISILRPGEARACKAPLQDTVAKACLVHTEATHGKRGVGSDADKDEKFRRGEIAWKVTKKAKYELTGKEPHQKTSYPTVQVESSIGFPMNFGLNFGINSDAKYTNIAHTAELDPGDYKIIVFAQDGAPADYALIIKESSK